VPGGEHTRAVRGLHLDVSLACETPIPAHHVDPGTLEPADLTSVVPAAGEAVPVIEHACDVELAGHRLVGTADPAGSGDGMTRAQQRLGRHARPVRAIPTDQPGLDDHRREPALDGTVGDVLTSRPGSDHHHVVDVRALVLGSTH
jgi:hypothetical protein